MDLFLTPTTVEFEKVGSEVTLPEDPNSWPMEILQELYKQAPYVADYDPDVMMARVDAERGYGFGHVQVGNKTELQPGAPQASQDAAGIRTVRIPVIVNAGKLQSLDVLVTEDSKMLPLTERRLRQALFRPQIFDVTSRTPGDTSIISNLFPPYRQQGGFGGQGVVVQAGPDGVGKMGSGTLLGSILATINEEDYQKLAAALAEPEVASAAFENREALKSSLEKLAAYEPGSFLAKQAQLGAALRPSVVQFCRHEGAYVVKSASHQAWAPVLQRLDRGQLVKMAGVDAAMDVDRTGSVTATTAPGPVTGDLEEDKPEIIHEYGIYKVQDAEGRHLTGFVFPNLIDLDGAPMPMALFTNGSQTALQGEIVGVRVAEGPNTVMGHPRGYGAFYKTLPNGKSQAMIPLDIKMAFNDVDGAGLVGHTVEGQEVHISFRSDVVKPTMADPQTLVMPDDWRWLPLDNSKAVTLASHPGEFNKVAAARKWPYGVEIRAGDGVVSLSGWPIDKVASEDRSFLNLDDALFYLAGMGVAPDYAVKKLGQAMQSSAPVTCQVAYPITTMAEAGREGMKKAAESLAGLPNLRRDLVKEALYIPSSTAVDTVLSLGFINPENLLTFIGYLPQLDASQSELCELLVSSRLGMREVPPYALERAIRGLEEVIEGLNLLAFRKN